MVKGQPGVIGAPRQSRLRGSSRQKPSKHRLLWTGNSLPGRPLLRLKPCPCCLQDRQRAGVDQRANWVFLWPLGLATLLAYRTRWPSLPKPSPPEPGRPRPPWEGRPEQCGCVRIRDWNLGDAGWYADPDPSMSVTWATFRLPKAPRLRQRSGTRKPASRLCQRREDPNHLSALQMGDGHSLGACHLPPATAWGFSMQG